MALLISPMIVPLIFGCGYVFLLCTHRDRVDALRRHSRPFGVGHPFVIITVTATLVGFDHSLTRAATSLGSSPTRTFFVVIVPLILPGVISARCWRSSPPSTEVVVVLFVGSVEQRTIPWKMFSGIREEIRPTILRSLHSGVRIDRVVDDGRTLTTAE